MKKFLICLTLLAGLCTGALAQVASDLDQPIGVTALEREEMVSEVQRHSDELAFLTRELKRLEIEIARLDALRSEVESLKGELTDSLMEISNVVAVVNSNMEAANTTLTAAETAVGASQSYLEFSALLITILALAASFFTWLVSRSIVGRTAKQLVKKLKSNGTNGQNSIIDEIKDTVHEQLYQDAVDNISFVMQDDAFRTKLGELIDRAVEEKCGTASGSGPFTFDEPSDRNAG